MPITQEYLYYPTLWTGPGTNEVTSPGYPGRYDNNLDTSTPIQVAEGSRIELSFADMDIEDEDTCSYDYVSGRDS